VRPARVADNSAVVVVLNVKVRMESQYFIPSESPGRDIVVGIETSYGLDGMGIESRWSQSFPQPSKCALEPSQPPIQRIPVLFRGGKAAGTWR
jgi:hypothetical protein